MTGGKTSASVTKFRLAASKAEQQIKSIAANSGNIKWSRHALTRMDERGIDDVDILRTLRSGMIAGDPEATQDPGWKCKMVKRIRGSREVGVVTIIIRGARLLIKTVEWEDVK